MLRHSATVVAAAFLVVLSLSSFVCAQETDIPAEQMVSKVLLDAAKGKYRAQDYEDAADLLEQSLEKWPQNADAAYWLAQTREKQDRGEDAAKLYQQYLKLTEGEGRTPERVLAGVRARKLDEKYENMMVLKEQVLLDAKALLATYGDDLSPAEKATLEALVAVLEGKATEQPQRETPEAGEEPAGRPPAGPFVELLGRVEPERHAVAGAWQLTRGGLASDGGTQARILIPIVPEGDYHLQVRFIRPPGDRPSAVVLPVGGDKQVLLELADRANLTIVHPDYKETLSAPLRKPMTAGRSYTCEVRVQMGAERVAIEAKLDGQPYLLWDGPRRGVWLHKLWELPNPNALGLRAHGVEAVFQSVRLRMLSGTARPVR